MWLGRFVAFAIAAMAAVVWALFPDADDGMVSTQRVLVGLSAAAVLAALASYCLVRIYRESEGARRPEWWTELDEQVHR